MKHISKLCLSAVIALSASLCSKSLAQTAAPKLLPFQGRLTDQNGVAVSNGVRLVQFKIYEVPSGGSPVWAGELHRTTVNGGLVNVMLGTKTPLANVDFDKQLYLEITVDVSGPTGQPDNSITLADPPMLPRQAIQPVVFAKEAAEARHAQNSTLLNSYDWSAFFDNGNPASGKIPGNRLAFTAGSIGISNISGGTLGGQSLGLNGPNGNLNVLLGPADAYPNQGSLGLYDSAGQSRLRAYVGTSGEGIIETLGPSGAPKVSLDSSWGADNGRLGLYDPSGLRVEAFAYPGGGGQVWLYGPAGNVGMQMGPNSQGRGSLALNNSSGGTRLQAYVGGAGNGYGTLETRGVAGNLALRLDTYASDYGRVQVFAPNDQIRAELYSAGSGYGALALFGPNGSFNVYAGPTGNENYGAVYVRNDSSQTKAGVFVDTDGAGAVIRDREYTSSDLRLKQEIQPITGASDAIRKMRGVSYARKSGSKFRGREMGVIAQEMKEALPEAVVSINLQAMMPKLPGSAAAPAEAQDTLYVDYNAIVAVLIESVKEQQVQIEDLKGRLKQLESRTR